MTDCQVLTDHYLTLFVRRRCFLDTVKRTTGTCVRSQCFCLCNYTSMMSMLLVAVPWQFCLIRAVWHYWVVVSAKRRFGLCEQQWAIYTSVHIVVIAHIDGSCVCWTIGVYMLLHIVFLHTIFLNLSGYNYQTCNGNGQPGILKTHQCKGCTVTGQGHKTTLFSVTAVQPILLTAFFTCVQSFTISSAMLWVCWQR